MAGGIGANIEQILLKVKNRRLFVIVVPLILGLLAGTQLVVRPATKRLAKIKTDIRGLAQKESSFKYIVETEKKVESYRSKLSKTGDKTWLIEQLNSIGNQTGVSIVSVTPEEPKKIGELIERVSVRVEAEAGYHALGQFVSQVESLDQLVKILGMDIFAGRSESAEPATGAAAVRGKRNIYKITMNVGMFTPLEGAL